ncbi:IS701-like element ISBj9 family transposase [Streptosporangium amethystogenes subsp. fukuiense]
MVVTARRPCPPAPGPLEEYATRFDDLWCSLAQRRGFREYLAGLLLPRDRNKTLTCLAGAEPVVGAQNAAVQRLQFFLSESPWDPEAINARRLELLRADPATAPHTGGVLVVDDTGDRKDGTATAHTAHQYLGSVGKIENGIVAVTTLWADERVYYPLHAPPYTPASRLPRGRSDPAFRTKPQLATALAGRAQAAAIPFRALVADCAYGDNAAFTAELWAARLPFVLALKPHKGSWAPADEAYTPIDAARELSWGGPQAPGVWTKVVRRFRDGHTTVWWAADAVLGGYGPHQAVRLIVATADPATLPVKATWYLATNLPRPGGPRAVASSFPPAGLAEIVRLYGLRTWIEQGYKQVKDELGWADFQVRSDAAIRRHWTLVMCAFTFCWHARPADSAPPPHLPPAPADADGGERGAHRHGATRATVLASGRPLRPRLADPLRAAATLVAQLVEQAPAR